MTILCAENCELFIPRAARAKQQYLAIDDAARQNLGCLVVRDANDKREATADFALPPQSAGERVGHQLGRGYDAFKHGQRARLLRGALALSQ